MRAVRREVIDLELGKQLDAMQGDRVVDERIRYLRNVMGLRLRQESLRTWELEGTPEDELRTSTVRLER